ncbi:hypothetical protein ACFO1B_48660 [Dactylosporangium siamense]|uniref:hypothetical protein n=1 Tax=Dactylosporangium siamense TaxID=685454 RepID=UPI00194356AD|nr:hypothetical protein [Dactylosporangium siamense]
MRADRDRPAGLVEHLLQHRAGRGEGPADEEAFQVDAERQAWAITCAQARTPEASGTIR